MPTDVDQLLPDGRLVLAPDVRLSPSRKRELLLDALPGASATTVEGVQAVRYEDKVILYKQVTHLGNPWPGYKKRIQVPGTWLQAEASIRADGLDPRFVGVYHHGEVTTFTDFVTSTYVQRKANNSAAHVATNDLYQALTLGTFTREDVRGNRLTTVRSDLFARHLSGRLSEEHPAVDVFRRFNVEMLGKGRIEALDAIAEMHRAQWPDRFQGEWPGFYLEFCLDRFVRAHHMDRWVEFQKVKRKTSFDYDLVLRDSDATTFFGDLKASTSARNEAPGNDAGDLLRCVQEYGRFWYVVYEHDTWLARANQDLATIAWNEWRWSVGHRAAGRTALEPLSYARRFKEAVDFTTMFVLEVNPANLDLVLGEFRQGHQPGGAPRAAKVMIKKKDVDNFLVFSQRA